MNDYIYNYDRAAPAQCSALGGGGMSQRFGRNQRRRAREEIAVQAQRVAALSAGIAMDRELLRHQGAQLREAEHYAKEIADMVGREAVIAGKPTKFAGHAYDGMRFAPITSLPSYAPSTNEISIHEMRYETLRLLDIECIRDQMRCQIHIRAGLAGVGAGYSMSESALRHMSEQEIQRRIAPEIAQFLAAELKKAWRK